MSFTADITQFCGKTKAGISIVVRKAVLDLHANIVTRSPVDTGRFRAANQISLNEIPRSSVISFNTDAQGKTTVSYASEDEVKKAGERAVGSFAIGDTFFLYNNVTYALALEYGHSSFAPEGVYRISAMELIAKLGGTYS